MNQEQQIKVIFGEERTTVHNYRFFYYLANELTHLALQDKGRMDAFRYAMGVVIFSYTTVEVFTNHIFHSKHYKIHELFSSLSDELIKKIERLSLLEKIEFALKFYPDSKVKELKKGEEPFQSFDILRQLRNFLIHYVPSEEVIRSDDEAYLKQITNLEKRASSKFKVEGLGSLNMAFVYRCFNKDCALWAFNLVQPFLDWLCDNLNIEKHELKRYWEVPPVGWRLPPIIISEETSLALEQRAHARGFSDVSKYVKRLISTDLLVAKSFDEILAPIRHTFQESGTSDDELQALFEEARDEVCQERKAHEG